MELPRLPVPSSNSSTSGVPYDCHPRSLALTSCSYSQFQISDGTGGNAEAQANAMERAYDGAGRLPSEVDFVECHVTGTAAGDPAEANWVGQRFARPGELLIGSVKGNIGFVRLIMTFAFI